MISEGSCDTEDWSNDAENSALITEIICILKHFQIENSYLKLQYNCLLFLYITFYIHTVYTCSLGEHKRLFQKKKKNELFQTLTGKVLS